MTISRQEKVSQRFHQCIATLSPQPVVIDFEGYRLTNQPFILKELSVRGVDYHDTILLRPPDSSNILNAKALKSYNWVTKTLHGLTWDSGNYDFSFVFCFFLSLKLRFPNILLYAKGREKCEYLSRFFPHIIDLDTLSCPKSSEFNKTDGFICLNHQTKYHRDHCAREKASFFFDRLTYCQQQPPQQQQQYQQEQPCQHCSGPNDQRQPTTSLIPEPNNFGINNTKRDNK